MQSRKVRISLGKGGEMKKSAYKVEKRKKKNIQKINRRANHDNDYIYST